MPKLLPLLALFLLFGCGSWENLDQKRGKDDKLVKTSTVNDKEQVLHFSMKHKLMALPAYTFVGILGSAMSILSGSAFKEPAYFFFGKLD